MKLAELQLNNFLGSKRFEDPERSQKYEINSGEDLVLWLNEDKANTNFTTNVNVTSLDAFQAWYRQLSGLGKEKGITLNFYRDPDDFSHTVEVLRVGETGTETLNDSPNFNSATYDTSDNLNYRVLGGDANTDKGAYVWIFPISEPTPTELDLTAHYKVGGGSTEFQFEAYHQGTGNQIFSNTGNTSTSHATITETVNLSDASLSQGDFIVIKGIIAHDGSNDGNVGPVEVSG